MPDKKLSKHLASLILMAAKETGTYEPGRALSRVEESMTLADYKEAEGFLGWVHEHGKAFGHGNIDAVYAEYAKTRAPAHPRSDRDE